MWPGAEYTWVGGIPSFRAVTNANGLNEDPADRPVAPPVARLSLANRSFFEKKSRPPTIALIAPVVGSITVMAPWGSVL